MISKQKAIFAFYRLSVDFLLYDVDHIVHGLGDAAPDDDRPLARRSR